MGLEYKIKRAAAIIKGLNAKDRKVLDGICGDIQVAERDLQDRAGPVMTRCLEQCRGLCCRNVHPDDLITLPDFVFILKMSGELEETMMKCASREPFFSGNCVFLADGQGPCLFPDDRRPEKCIISFCGGDQPIGREIRQVRGHFNRLHRFVLLTLPKRMGRFLTRFKPVAHG